MKNYIGIDLGTTNSAICSFDGSDIRIWKSPAEQNDVTPSAIYFDRRGNKYIGKRAYDAAPLSPDNTTMLFKRLMGTSTPIKLSALDITMTPEECSAEVLRVMFGYLDEEIRNDFDVGTVITVPAAFNQMQKTATMQAAELAGIGRVALMQEPVAAVMSILHSRSLDGIFVVYDLGGGTFDIALAESFGGRINLLGHGGIALCGGRDFDRMLVDSVVKPWLFENFDLPDNLSTNPRYRLLLQLAARAAERAKIELSAREESVISLTESEIRSRDQSGEELYVNIPLARATMDLLIDEKISETIEAVRETLANNGISQHDVERIVFIGGPTNYKPLRDKVSFELGISASSEVNPMTAVAEGAAVFAESIDWQSENRGRKSSRSSLESTEVSNLRFNFTARTPSKSAKVVVQYECEEITEREFQIDSLDTGWTSGRIPLKNGKIVDVPLMKTGDNSFKAFVFDAFGAPISLENDKLIITRTAATVDAIPASHSIGIAVRKQIGGAPTVEWMVRKGDELPSKVTKIFQAESSLKSGSSRSLDFFVLEGESEEPFDNRNIGTLSITGNDFEDGVIPAGGDLECDFEMRDDGCIYMAVSIPSIRGTFDSGRNYYSSQEGQRDFSKESKRIYEEGNLALKRINEVETVVADPRLDQALKKLTASLELDSDETDTERNQEAQEGVLEALRLLAQVREDNQSNIRQKELERVKLFFNDGISEYSRPSEKRTIDNLTKTAQRSIDHNDRDFETYISELRSMIFEILFRQDWFVVHIFNQLASSPHRFLNTAPFDELVENGKQCLQDDDIDELRAVVAHLSQFQIEIGTYPDMMDIDINILRT